MWQSRQSICSSGFYSLIWNGLKKCTNKYKLQDVIGTLKGEYKKPGVQGLRGKEYTNQFSLQSKGAVTVEDYWTECQYYDIV